MFKKVFKWLFYTTLTVVLGITLSVYLFKDRIIERVLVEVNNYLVVPVSVSKVDIDFLHGLPNISIAFYDVVLPADTDPVITAGKFYAILNPLELLRGDMNIARIEIEDAALNLAVDAKNKDNLSRLFKTADTAKLDDQDSTATGFNLNTIILRNVKVSYTNLFTGVRAKADIDNLRGGFHLNKGIYETRLNTSLQINEYKSPAWTVADLGAVEIDFDMLFDVQARRLDFNDSRLTYKGAQAQVDGNILFGNVPELNLEVNADQISFANLAKFLPPGYAQTIEQYKSTGSIDFVASVKGAVGQKQLPAIKAELAFKDVDLTDKTTKARIRDLNLTCQLDIPDLGKLATASVKIDKGQGLLQDEPMSLTFQLKNFNSPQYSGRVNGTVETSWLLAVLKFAQHDSATGQIEIAVEARKPAGRELVLSGNVDLKAVSLGLNDTLKISKINGLARFNPDGIELSNVYMKWLSSDVTVNGTLLYNILADGPTSLRLKSDLKSGKLAIEDIVSLVRGSSGLFTKDSARKSDVNLDLDLIANFDSLTFRRFKGAKIGGEILYQEEVLEVIDLNGRAMGGTLRLNGKLKQMLNDDLVIQANAKTRNVYIDSLFYVFNNFSQDFIRDEHLKGRVFADVDALMYFDKNWRFRRQLLSSTAKIGIVDGQLNNFEPIMALSPYLDDKEDNLSRLRFSELINNIQIKQDTVFIPEMSIRTNVRNIALGGYHTLDQHINYQLAVPIINERVDKDEAFGAIQKSSKGSPNLLFRIKGTTSDYKVNYDLLRATGNVLKLLDITKIFRKKEEVEMDSSFLDDEEFDW